MSKSGRNAHEPPNRSIISHPPPAERDRIRHSTLTTHPPLSAFPVHPLCTIRLQSSPDAHHYFPPPSKPRLICASARLARWLFHLSRFGKSAATLFLNCTKNTELTTRPFARTFSFALTEFTARNQHKKNYPAQSGKADRRNRCCSRQAILNPFVPG